MISATDPLVSCICVTHNAVEYLKKSVHCFQQQTYSRKELIVAFSSDNTTASHFVGTLRDPSIRTLIFPADQALTLGEKRNQAVNYANGIYFCVWDDDDWHNVDRISACVRSLDGSSFVSCALSSVILYDAINNEAYLSATRWAWEQTLFCQKSVLENPVFQYRNLQRGEDSPLLYDLKMSNRLLTISNSGLYVYVYHGKNTFQRQHWDDNLLQWATKLSPEQSVLIRQIVNSELSPVEGSSKLSSLFPS